MSSLTQHNGQIGEGAFPIEAGETICLHSTRLTLVSFGFGLRFFVFGVHGLGFQGSWLRVYRGS